MNRPVLGDAVRLFALALLGVFLVVSPDSAFAESGPPKPTSKDKCPVCGMFVSKYPDWTATIVFKDGSSVFFDGAKDMFKYLSDMKRYTSSKKPEDIDAVWVMDYYALSPTNARKAWYVVGSDVFGPMGKELVPLEKESDAKEFMMDHKGTRMFTFSGITAGVVRSLE